MQGSQLSQVPPRQRTLLALLIVPVGLALLAGGALVVLGTSVALARLAGLLVALLALGLLGVAHGLFWSARRDRAEQLLDRTIQDTAGSTASCGRDCLTGCGATDCAVQALPRR
jgi:membrane protein implicated in regulation of membrane protease activity